LIENNKLSSFHSTSTTNVTVDVQRYDFRGFYENKTI